MEKTKKVYYYKEYTDDMVESKKQNFKLKDDYIWIHNNFIYKIISNIVYFILWIFGILYFKIALRGKIKNKKILKKYKNEGYFIYANHTQPIGDVAIPALASGRKRIYVVINTANFRNTCYR